MLVQIRAGPRFLIKTRSELVQDFLKFMGPVQPSPEFFDLRIGCEFLEPFFESGPGHFTVCRLDINAVLTIFLELLVNRSTSVIQDQKD